VRIAAIRRDAGGSRTHLNRVAAGRLAVWLQRHRTIENGTDIGTMPSPGIEPGPRPSQGRVRIRHTPRTRCRADRESPARESDPALRLRRPPCLRHTRGEDRCRPGRDERTGTMPSPGVEPGLRPSEGRVRFHHTPRAFLDNRLVSQDYVIPLIP
jgi:hypothetical protein